MQKQERHNSILRLIDAYPVASQTQLASKLREQGFNVTQASVSRDLDELGVVKLEGTYTLPKKAVSESEYGKVVFETAGENLIVGRCASGLASAITVKIDAARLKEIVGTVAGDDTILIAVKDKNGQSIALESLTSLFDE